MLCYIHFALSIKLWKSRQAKQWSFPLFTSPKSITYKKTSLVFSCFVSFVRAHIKRAIPPFPAFSFSEHLFILSFPFLGNNHAIEHYQSTGYPLAVKLGTITKEGKGGTHSAHIKHAHIIHAFMHDREWNNTRMQRAHAHSSFHLIRGLYSPHLHRSLVAFFTHPLHTDV